MRRLDASVASCDRASATRERESPSFAIGEVIVIPASPCTSPTLTRCAWFADASPQLIFIALLSMMSTGRDAPSDASSERVRGTQPRAPRPRRRRHVRHYSTDSSSTARTDPYPRRRRRRRASPMRLKVLGECCPRGTGARLRVESLSGRHAQGPAVALDGAHVDGPGRARARVFNDRVSAELHADRRGDAHWRIPAPGGLYTRNRRRGAWHEVPWKRAHAGVSPALSVPINQCDEATRPRYCALSPRNIASAGYRADLSGCVRRWFQAGRSAD